VAIFLGFIIATIASVLESVGDYFAAASVCQVPPPPAHAINRGIAIEGLGSILSGAIGAGHATTSFSQNIASIAITKV
jgi:nucleobase transporter 1/2